MNILDALKQLRDDIKIWVANNLNELNTRLTKAINNIPKFSGNYNDLTDAPNIAEDESGNMVIADESGNVIFKADADGIHTTAVSLNGEAAATEKYVDEAVANADVDLTGYATEDFVASAVESAKEDLSESIESESDGWKIVDEAGNIIFSVDAEGAHTTELTLNGDAAATESYVDETIAKIDIPTTDLTDYATKKYVDDAVAGVDFTGYATETYVDNKVADLVNSAPEALNTLGELATALESHEDAYDALLETVGGKATQEDLNNLKEELSESIVSEADEWKVVDENGNIIFSVDADGAHMTSMTLNGQPIEDMIDDKVPTVVDSLDSTSTTDALSAAQGKALKKAIDSITTDLGDMGGGDMMKATYDTDGDGIIDNSSRLEGHAANYFATAEHAHELANLNEDANHRTVSDTEKAAWNNKVTQVDGKQLSTNDFTDEYKNKLDGLDNIVVEETDPTVPAWAKAETKPTYTAQEVGALPATTKLADLSDDATHRTVTDEEKVAWSNKVDKVEGKQLSTNDFTNEYKTKLDNINEGGGGIVVEEDPTVPAWAKEPTKPAYTAEEVGALPNTTSLFSGDYNDLENAPNIQEDDTGDFVIADNNGNILFRANNNGLETTQLTIGNLVVNGMTIQELIRSVINETSV